MTANSSYGIYGYASSGASITLNVKNSVVTSNGNYGIYRDSTGGINTTTATYNDVWNNSTGNYYNLSAGTGSQSANPLFVSTTNVRLTSRSPARFASDVASDIGALPYTVDLTPTLQGVLWTNTQFTLAGSPYTVVGDLTVPPGVTLTIDPGVVVQMAGSDGMGTGFDINRVEFTVRGTLSAVGTLANPITLKAQSGTNPSLWYGLVFNLATAVTTDWVTIQNATYGVYVYDGAATVNGITALTNQYGAYFANKASGRSPTRCCATTRAWVSMSASPRGTRRSTSPTAR